MLKDEQKFNPANRPHAGLELTTVDGQKTKWFDHGALNSLLKGKMEIVKLPWKPKKGEEYYTFGTSAGEWEVSQQRWTCHPFDLAVLDKGWVYRTRAEAETALPAVAKEMGVEFIA